MSALGHPCLICGKPGTGVTKEPAISYTVCGEHQRGDETADRLLAALKVMFGGWAA
jgi:hypothetical protein